MTYLLRRIGDATEFQSDFHVGVHPTRIAGTESIEPISVVLSHYEPGGHADRSSLALDTTYVVLTGQLTISLDDETVELGHLDSLFLPAGSMRAVDNFSDGPASLLVIRPKK
jgi:quercetin dioxygenase-like cupin family protein